MLAEIARCRREQAIAMQNYIETGHWTALLGYADWGSEELEILRAQESDGDTPDGNK